MFKLPGPLDPSLTEMPLLDKRGKKSLGKKKGEERYKAMLKKVTKRAFFPSVTTATTTPSYLVVSCAVGQGEKREPPKKEKKGKEKKKNRLCDPPVLKGRRE